jgi:hypothetical protein
MKKRRNVLISSSVLHKIRLSAVRAEQVRQDIFDGRYRTKKNLQKRYIIEVKLNVKRCKIPFNPVKNC